MLSFNKTFILDIRKLYEIQITKLFFKIAKVKKIVIIKVVAIRTLITVNIITFSIILCLNEKTFIREKRKHRDFIKK